MSHLHPGTADADSHGMPLHHSTFYKYGEKSYSPNASDMVAPAKIQEPWTMVREPWNMVREVWNMTSSKQKH